MNNGMRISSKLFDLLREEEGYSSKPYLCPARVWTIGYGSTMYEDGKAVRQGDPEIDEIRAIALVDAHMESFVYPIIYTHVKVKLNQNQFDAISDFIYNIGGGAFTKSTLLKKLNAGDFEGAANEFKKWNMGGGKVLAGLVRRREKEEKMFMKPIQ